MKLPQAFGFITGFVLSVTIRFPRMRRPLRSIGQQPQMDPHP